LRTRGTLYDVPSYWRMHHDSRYTTGCSNDCQKPATLWWPNRVHFRYTVHMGPGLGAAEPRPVSAPGGVHRGPATHWRTSRITQFRW